MGLQYVANFQPFLVTADPAEAANYSAQRIADRIRPNRGTRSTSTAQQDFYLDLLSVQSIGLVAIHKCNFASFEIAHSSNGVSYTNVTGSPFTISQDPMDEYRKAWIAFSSQSKRWWRIRIPSQTPTDGDTAFTLGTVFLVSLADRQELARGPRVPLPIRKNQAYLANALGSREEVSVNGDLYLTMDWLQNLDPAGASEWQQLVRNHQHTPLLIYYNRGNTYECYFGTLQTSQGVQVSLWPNYSAISVPFRQKV